MQFNWLSGMEILSNVIGLIPEALGPVLEVARKEFPTPYIPLNFIKEILRLAHEELKEESSPQQLESPHSER